MLPLLLVAAAHAEEQRVLFAGGCFWSIELAFQRVPGVIRTAVGYAGGHTLSPVTYQAVVTGTTGHAETVEVVYDPQRVSFERLVDLFWQLHDPTSLNQQGGDAGTQYRSAIWYTSEAQRVAVAASLARLPADVRRRVVTQISSATAKGFLWEVGEGYHQQYLQKAGQEATTGSLKPIQCYGNRGPIKKMDKPGIRAILKGEL